MGNVSPKQYLPLVGRPLIWHAMSALCEAPAIARVFVVLAVDDSFWPADEMAALGPKLRVLRCGGATRAQSVANGLRAMAAELGDIADDWVLVHDAARPCLTVTLVEKLIAEVGENTGEDAVGGLLAAPLADTLKRADAGGCCAATVSREGLWQAQTPQMFRYGVLSRALADHPGVTDEAGAIEAAGLKPKLVRGDASNLKVTYPADLRLAELILQGKSS